MQQVTTETINFYHSANAHNGQRTKNSKQFWSITETTESIICKGSNKQIFVDNLLLTKSSQLQAIIAHSICKNLGLVRIQEFSVVMDCLIALENVLKLHFIYNAHFMHSVQYTSHNHSDLYITVLIGLPITNAHYTNI